MELEFFRTDRGLSSPSGRRRLISSSISLRRRSWSTMARCLSSFTWSSVDSRLPPSLIHSSSRRTCSSFSRRSCCSSSCRRRSCTRRTSVWCCSSANLTRRTNSSSDERQTSSFNWWPAVGSTVWRIWLMISCWGQNFSQYLGQLWWLLLNMVNATKYGGCKCY